VARWIGDANSVACLRSTCVCQPGTIGCPLIIRFSALRNGRDVLYAGTGNRFSGAHAETRGSHVQSCIWELVPHSPELSHIGCGAQGETDVSIHAPDRGSYYDSMLAEVFDDLLGRSVRIHHHEILYANLPGGQVVPRIIGHRDARSRLREGRAIRNGATNSNESDHRSLQSRNTGEITREQ
jgi:hypothetical protein